MNTAINEIPYDSTRLLVVDDDEAVRKLFQTILTMALPKGSTVDTVVNGAEAVASFRAHHHALVLMDLHMPVKDGREAFYEIRDFCTQEKWQMPSVVFCTGFAPPDGVAQVVRESPRHALLSKPVDASTLIGAVRSRLMQ